MNETLQRMQHVHGMGPYSTALVEMLKNGKPGDEVTDETLEGEVGGSCRPNGPRYGNLMTAIRHVQSHHGRVWERRRHAGCIRCLNADETVTSGQADLSGIRRRSQRAVRKMQTVNPNDLSGERRSQFVAFTTQLKVVAVFATNNMGKKLTARRVEETPDPKRLMEAIIANE